MYAKRLALAVGLWLVPAAGLAIGPEVRRVTPANRPYIVEIGEPHAIDSYGLDRERKINSDLRAYLNLYGWPDYAEVQEIEPVIPWDAYEVRIYYLRRNTEIHFGRAFISPSVTDLGVVKYEGRMDAGTRDRIVALVTPAQTGEPEPVVIRREEPAAVEVAAAPVEVAAAPVEPPDELELIIQRMEAAADRATVAAEKAAAASEAANASADRTVSVLEKLAR
jgi:hypothetical protein